MRNFLIFFLMSNMCFGQTSLCDAFTKIDSEIHLISLGENHTIDNRHFQEGVLNCLSKRQDFEYVILEIPDVFAELINEYVLNKNSLARIKSILSVYPKQTKLNLLSIINWVYLFNRSNNRNIIKVRGMDIFNFGRLDESLFVASVLFPKLREVDTETSNKFFNRKKRISRKDSYQVINELTSDISDNLLLYQTILGLDYNKFFFAIGQLGEQFPENYNFKTDFKKQIEFREKYMELECLKIIDTNHIQLLITGGNHVLKSPLDEYFPDRSSYLPLIYMLNKQLQISTLSIFTQYKKFSIFPYSWLDRPNRKYFKNRKMEYVLLQESNLEKESFASKFCDWIVILNVFRIPKMEPS